MGYGVSEFSLIDRRSHSEVSLDIGNADGEENNVVAERVGVKSTSRDHSTSNNRDRASTRGQVSQIRSFAPNAEETVFFPRLVGG